VATAPRVGLAVCEPRGIDGSFPVDVQPAKGQGPCAGVVNSDGTSSALFFNLKLKKGQSQPPAELLRAGSSCRGGSRHGQACESGSECPGGSCFSPSIQECSADAKGKLVAFTWSDYRGESLYFRNSKGTVSQVTNLPCWCSDDVSKACTASADCTGGASCTCPGMFGVQLSAKGDLGTFVTDGDAGGNPGHANALYAFDVNVKKNTAPAVRGPLGEHARVCDQSTANRGQPCTKDEDCGAVCGDGNLVPGEQCDGSGCSQAQRCLTSGASRCTCQARSCGDGIVDFDLQEQCDGTSCSDGFRCVAPGGPGACQCVPIAKPVCGNGVVEEPFEECDNSPCPPFQQCVAHDPNSPNPNECSCDAIPNSSCGNSRLDFGEQCDGANFPCSPGFQCTLSCFCQSSAVCGNNVVEPGEVCDGTNIGACPAGFMCTSCECTG